MKTERSRQYILIILVTGFLAYSFFLYLSLPVKGRVPGEAAEKGKLVWQQYNCGACHQVYGLGGFLGPDLTNVYSSRGPAYIKVFLKNGTNIMPDFRLTEKEMNALTGFLQNIDSSGKSSPKTFAIKYDGTIEQP